jgi:hypothetical protein
MTKLLLAFALGGCASVPTGAECGKLGGHLDDLLARGAKPRNATAITLAAHRAETALLCVNYLTRAEYDCGTAANDCDTFGKCLERALHEAVAHAGEPKHQLDDAQCNRLTRRLRGEGSSTGQEEQDADEDCMRLGTKRLYACIVDAKDDDALALCLPGASWPE